MWLPAHSNISWLHIDDICLLVLSDTSGVPRHPEVAVKTVKRSHVLWAQHTFPRGIDVCVDVRGAIALRDGGHSMLQAPQDHHLRANIDLGKTGLQAQSQEHLCWRDAIGFRYAHNRWVLQLGAFGQRAVSLSTRSVTTR